MISSQPSANHAEIMLENLWPEHRAGLLWSIFFGQPGSVSKFPPFLWVKLWVGWVGRGYIEISRYFPALWINRVTLVTKIKLWYSLGRILLQMIRCSREQNISASDEYVQQITIAMRAMINRYWVLSEYANARAEGLSSGRSSMQNSPCKYYEWITARIP